jgi:hypothetical protein
MTHLADLRAEHAEAGGNANADFFFALEVLEVLPASSLQCSARAAAALVGYDSTTQPVQKWY